MQTLNDLSTNFTKCIVAIICLIAALVHIDESSAQEQSKNGAKEKNKSTQEKWVSMFDGKSLENWKSAKFGGDGKLEVKNGEIHMDVGVSLTGINYTGKFPSMNYEVEYEAKQVDGIDFFGALTFPVNKDHCTFVNGGWAGSTVGISCLDDLDASENKTTKIITFKKGQWYKFRVQVTDKKIHCWIDDKLVIDFDHTKHKISTRPEVDPNKPIGLSAFQTRAAIRNIKYRKLTGEKKPTADQKKDKSK